MGSVLPFFLPCFIPPHLKLWVKNKSIYWKQVFQREKNPCLNHLIVYIKTVTIQTHAALCVQCLSMCDNSLSNFRIAHLFIKCIFSNLMPFGYFATKIPSQHDPSTYVEGKDNLHIFPNKCIFMQLAYIKTFTQGLVLPLLKWIKLYYHFCRSLCAF